MRSGTLVRRLALAAVLALLTGNNACGSPAGGEHMVFRKMTRPPLRGARSWVKPFAHEAVLIMEPDAGVRAPGAAVTVALCGRWDHQPPCPLAPHHVSAREDGGELRVRILFAAGPGTEGQVRHLIGQALPGQLKFPDGFTTPWRLHASWPSEVPAEETKHAGRLIRS